MPRKIHQKDQKIPVLQPAFDPIAAALKRLHDTVESEAVPDDFLRILDEIDAKIASAKSNSQVSDNG